MAYEPKYMSETETTEFWSVMDMIGEIIEEKRYEQL